MFFGRITASVSHEINNVLAITNELAGLLEDIAYAAGQGAEIDGQKLTDTSKSIQKQVQRGKETVHRLNRFAHSVDNWVSEFDLNVVLNDIVGLSQRFAYRMGVRLEVAASEEPVSILGNMFFFQQVIFTALVTVMGSQEPDEVIHVSCVRSEGGAEIRIIARKGREGSDSHGGLRALEQLMQEFGGHAQLESVDETRQVLILSFPAHGPQVGDLPSG